ncbi:MAG: pyridoxal-phosphate dependent enzyme [Thermofilaceae archaeon]
MTEEDSSSKLVERSTPLIRSRVLARFLGFDGKPLYFKWEGANPTGTHKDRAALAHVLSALERGMEVVTVGTCGNYGVALAYYARQFGLSAVIYVPAGYENSRIDEMRRLGAKVVLVEGGYEEAVEASVRAAASNGWYDANPGSVNNELSLEAYSNIASEIVRQLGDAPYAVAVPVGNGTTLAGLYRGFLRMYREGYATGIPRLIAATTSHANQLALIWRREATLDEPVQVRETWINEPLAAAKALDAVEALEALRSTRGAVYTFSDEEMLEAAMLMRALERLPALPASASSLLALNKLKSEELEGPVVAVVTGRWMNGRKLSY